MKLKNTSDFLIALTVIGCSLLLLAAMSMALTGFSFGKKPGRTVAIDLPSVTGLRVNSEVRYAGAEVGKILSIEPLDWDRRTHPDLAVRIIAEIDRPMPALKTDSEAAITSDTILAEKFLDLTPGTASAALLADGQPITARKVATFDDLTREGLDMLTELNSIVTSVKAKNPDLPEKVNALLANAQNLSANADELIERLNELTEKNNGKIDQTLGDLNVVLQNLKVVSTYAKALTGTIGQKPWRVFWGGETPPLPSEQEILASDKPLPVPPPKK
ncbi:MAG: MlaD family protein [Candidatus Methylacidiphilales bacterium]|nr:MlaD family protein [Candidatus Methylacidiphilales bacterium]